MITAPTNKSTNKANGFTLIEILVSLAIMTTVLGLSIAALIQFNERQQVKNVAKQIQTLMRSAQAKAQVREVPTLGSQPCSSLLAYRIIPSGSSVLLRTRCTEGTYTRDQYRIPDGIELESTFQWVDFLPLNGQVNTSLSQPSINIITRKSDGSNRFQFTVTQGGSISEGEFLN